MHRAEPIFLHGSAAIVGQGFLIIEVSQSHWNAHTRKKSSGRVISPRRDLYLITHNMHERQTFKLPVEFKPTTLQTYASDRVETGSGRTIVTRTFVPKLLWDC